MDENAVFEAVRELAASGAYLDDIPGIPVTSMSSSAQYRRTPDGRYTRIFRRHPPDVAHVSADGRADPLPALRTATADAVAQAESAIGHPLPPLLRRLYLEVGNGGFGPGYGVLGLADGRRDDTGHTAIDLYRLAHETPGSAWSFLPAGLLPVCYWGCAVYSFTDCSQPDGRMWGWDPNPGPTGLKALFRESVGLAGWLDRWLTGTLCQPCLVQDPVTRDWRGATDEEYAQLMAELCDPAV